MLIFAFCLQRGEGTRPGLPGKQFRRESRPRPRRRPHTAAPTWIVIPKTCVYQRARKSGPTEAGEIAGRPEKGGGRGALRKTAPGISLRNRPCQRACAGTVSLLTSWAASRTRWEYARGRICDLNRRRRADKPTGQKRASAVRGISLHPLGSGGGAERVKGGAIGVCPGPGTG